MEDRNFLGLSESTLRVRVRCFSTMHRPFLPRNVKLDSSSVRTCSQVSSYQKACGGPQHGTAGVKRDATRTELCMNCDYCTLCMQISSYPLGLCSSFGVKLTEFATHRE